MRALFATATLAVTAILLACGGQAAPDLEEWDTLSQELRSSVQGYREAMETAPTPDRCAELRQAYLAELQPRMERMRAMSADLDGCMRRMRHMEDADVEMTCRSMDEELARYAEDGCASEDAVVNQSNAFAHCYYMLERLNDTDARSRQMGGMMGDGAMGDGMMSGGMCGN